ncbi:MAG TPA: histidine kinase N-terminal domain-containing protein [Chloroflexota bacterium]|nr:histidine kinase N-terminal domain-containing protein [Chloroflexota bacterium]
MDAVGHHARQPADALSLGADLRLEEAVLLNRVAEGLDLLADISHADLLLYARSGDCARVIAQSRPTTVPSIYPDSLVGQDFTSEMEPSIHRALFSSRTAQGIKRQLVRGSPTVQEIFPVRNAEGAIIGVLSREMNQQEHERRKKKNPILMDALTRLRQAVMDGQLKGSAELSSLGAHYAIMVIDRNGRVLYISSLAEQLYRKIGFTTSLLGRRLTELDTNEHLVFKAMEQEVCLEQQIEDHNLVWVKSAIPLPAEPRHTLLENVLKNGFSRRERVACALVLIRDVTEAQRKEQALRIKSAMIREIHHRVKNNLQTIAALLRMQARRTGSPEVLDMLKQSINRILSIALVHEFLSKGETEEGASLISMREVAQRILSEVTQGILDPEKSIRMELEGEDFCLPTQQATSCALVINELLQNSVVHGFETLNQGRILVTLREEGGMQVIEVQDDGEGLPPDFDMERDGSLGLQIIQTLVQEDLKGRFTMASNGGVHARVAFPGHS